ncbi:hypothetical protein DXG01_015119 [Tephrocybe rancida]|nr:hypothetical protein DXG01_015119 [Tephrocybe rancida]
MPPRLDPGTVGRKVLADTNAFTLNWKRPSNNAGFVYHYDVILPLWETTREFTLGNKKGTEIIMRLQQTVRPDIFNPLGAFDGKKNLFSFAEYRFKSEEFHVPWQGVPSNRPKEVSVRVVFVKKIDVSTLHRLTQGDANSIRPESDSSTALNMLNLFIQSTPRMTDPRIFNAKSFFTPHQKHTSPKIHPLELWRGHFQSVRPTPDRIIVNVDVTIGVILPAGNLEQICGEYLHLRSAHEFKAIHVPRLRLFLKGVKVEVTLPGHSGKRPKTIKDVVLDVGGIKFEKDGERISVADHFALAHRYTIRSGSLGVKLGSDGVFPMSACRTTQQLYKNRSSPEVVREALEFSPRDPKQRMGTITAGWQELRYSQSSFLMGAGISVDPRPLAVHGRLLPSPTISFGKNENLTPQRQGTWDVMRKQFIKPASIASWTVVDFANADPAVLNMFVNDLGQCMMERGMRLERPRDTVRRSPNADIEAVCLLSVVSYGAPKFICGRQILREAGRAAEARLILVILPESAPHPYREVKKFGDITQGVATHQKWSRKLAGDAQQRKANQYQNNLILKINAKLGGINYVPKDPYMDYLKQVPTMVIGIHVSVIFWVNTYLP